jgi:hypothetical protein
LTIAPAASNLTGMALEGTSTSGKFKVFINWTSNDIGQDNSFDLSFLDAESGNELSNVSYSIMLLKGQEELDESKRDDQTAAQQNYTFDEEGSYTLRIQDINGAGTEDRIDVPMQVTPEFPSLVMLTLAVLFGTILVASRKRVL